MSMVGRPPTMQDALKLARDLWKPEVHGFSGTRQVLTARQRRVVQEVVNDLPADCLVITGGCTGVDAFVARAAKQRGLRVKTILPADRRHVDPDWQQYCDEYVEAGTFKERNQLIVDSSTHLHGCPLYTEGDTRSKRSGTWQTIRMAWRAGITTRVLILHWD